MKLFLAIIVLLHSLQASRSEAQAPLPAFWEKTTVMLEKVVSSTAGQMDTVPHGTGFLFADSALGVLLVTNRHILENRREIVVRYNKTQVEGDGVRGFIREVYPLTGSDSLPLWKPHPLREYDVAALPVQKPRVDVDVAFLDDSRVRVFDSLNVGEEVFFFGFPLLLLNRGSQGDFPVLRAGIVSYKAMEFTHIGGVFLPGGVFLLDGFSFGGNSGSPVLTRVTPRGRASLAGIVFGHVPNTQEIVLEHHPATIVMSTGDTATIIVPPDTVRVAENAGLARVVCADRIRELIELFRHPNED